jgi:hypothetical protein
MNKERSKYISEQAARALGCARVWFGEASPTEAQYEEIRVWILARLAERGISESEISLVVDLDHETKRAAFNFKLKRS